MPPKIFFFGVGVLLALYSCKQCARYICNSQLPDNICVKALNHVDPSSGSQYYTEYQLKACQGDRKCELTNTKNGPAGFCHLPFEKGSHIGNYLPKIPGSKCMNNVECQSNQCRENICYGKAKESECENHIDCHLGLRCNERTNRCEEQIGIKNSGCTDDYDCVNTAGCLKGQCVEYYSIPDDGYSEHDHLCASGYQRNSVCKPGPKIMNKKPPYGCIVSVSDDHVEQCEYTNSDGSTFFLPCQCGMNRGGAGFCPLSKGDGEYISLIRSFKALVANDCHTIARSDFSLCTSLNIHDAKYQNLKINSYIYLNNPLLQQNELCLKETMLYDFYHIKCGSSQAQASSLNTIFLVMLVYLLLL